MHLHPFSLKFSYLPFPALECKRAWHSLFCLADLRHSWKKAAGLNLSSKLDQKSENLSQKVQWSAFSIGILCFFDGLASALLTGRALRPLADKTGVSRAKLAYIVDSTGSAVACVAIMSTWIAYQLSMIREGYLVAGIPDSRTFSLFFLPIPEISTACLLLF